MREQSEHVAPFDHPGHRRIVREAREVGIFAERDDFVPPEAARKLEADLRSAGKRARIEIYPGVGHAFFNDSRPDAYDAKAAARARAEMLAFLRAELA